MSSENNLSLVPNPSKQGREPHIHSISQFKEAKIETGDHSHRFFIKMIHQSGMELLGILEMRNPGVGCGEVTIPLCNTEYTERTLGEHNRSFIPNGLKDTGLKRGSQRTENGHKVNITTETFFINIMNDFPILGEEISIAFTPNRDFLPYIVTDNKMPESAQIFVIFMSNILKNWRFEPIPADQLPSEEKLTPAA